ncbi:unnamed protein product [Leptosia nina]|uniref:FYVE-type domain-containing protein n=1 Tax=Leptosia nina TaxID=320188 RepID=A0AAV1JLW3_9NEOP
MSCNSCSKGFSLLRSEKGCPCCGFSYCSKCLNNKIFLPKLNCEAKVCVKCKNATNSTVKTNIDPPAAYYKRIGNVDNKISNLDSKDQTLDMEIKNRLQKLKEPQSSTHYSDRDIEARLKKLKDVPSISEADLEQRLANIKGVSVESMKSKPITINPDLRTEEEQTNDLLRQYMAQSNMDQNYEDEFNNKISDIESRLQKLKGSTTTGVTVQETSPHQDEESEESIINKIIEQAKIESFDSENTASTNDELPFCEICNEDAVMRCMGCKYLFCKQCFIEHKDEDDGCDKFEPYTAPKNNVY